MPAINPFESQPTSDATSPARRLLDIDAQKSNTVDLTHVVRSIYCGVGGNIAVVDLNGVTITHQNVAAGSYIGPFAVARVMVTNTTATGLIGYV